jgi:CubicO group peptidase (beta-lactamase class C family)
VPALHIGLCINDERRMRVFEGGSADAPATRAAQGPITIRHLLTHTPGFAVYGKADR